VEEAAKTAAAEEEVSPRCRRRSAGTAESHGKWGGWTRSAGRVCPCSRPFPTLNSWKPQHENRLTTSLNDPAGGTFLHTTIGHGK